MTHRVAVDLDGTLYEFHSAFAYMLREYRGFEMPPLEMWEWDTPSTAPTKYDQNWMWTKGVELGLFRFGHVVKGAIIGVRKLVEMGYELSVVTHRPRAAVSDTIAWLAYVNLPFDEVHILSDGQSKSSVPGDVLIDDKPANVEEWKAHGRRAILFSQPWNRKFPWVERAEGWKGVVECLTVKS